MVDIDGDEKTGPVELIDDEAVARAVRPYLRPTTFIDARPLSKALGAEVLLVSETLQHTGSFKYRAATSVVLHHPAEHFLAASSGNFGAALAAAAARVGKRVTLVMPAQSSQAKIDAARSYGADIELIDTAKTSRKERVAELSAQHPDWTVVSAYDDLWVIAGNTTLGTELFTADAPEMVLVPVGGGGLSAGIVRAAEKLRPGCAVWGAEPALANDAARSLRAGVLTSVDAEPNTICDGARTPSLGQRNFAILRRGMAGIVEVPDDAVRQAMRLLFEKANLKVEPTGALGVAALLVDKTTFADRRVAIVISGGNVDNQLFASVL